MEPSLSLAFKGLLSRRKTKGNEIDDKKCWFLVFKSTVDLGGFFCREGLRITAAEPILHPSEGVDVCLSNNKGAALMLL